MSECNCDDPDYPQGVCFCGSAFSCPHGRGATVGVGSKCEICHLEAKNKTLEVDNNALRKRCELAETALLTCIAIPKREKNTFDATCEILHVMNDWQQAADAAKGE